MTTLHPVLGAVWAEERATEVLALFQHAFVLASEAQLAESRGDMERVLGALAEREEVTARAEPLLRELLGARASWADHPMLAGELERLIAAIAEQAEQLAASDAELMQRLADAHERLNRQLAHLDAPPADPYHPHPAAAARLDRVG
jgi:hypothetical protein